MKGKRFCVINCEDSLRWAPRNFSHMFMESLTLVNDVWIEVNVALGQSLPEDILEFDGMVITGSHYNCRDHESLPWFNSLCELIRKIAEKGTPRIFAGCFGCQITAYALGGKVDYNPEKNFLLRAEHIVIDEKSKATLPLEDAPGYWFSTGANIIVSHGDSVITLPEHAHRIGASVSCRNEIFLAGSDNNILACQSHPEFDYEYCIKDRIWPAIMEHNRLTPDEAVFSAKTFENFTGEDSQKFLSMVNRFLRKA
jgi:GMP synthase (glutamine-hydrolysing)